MLPALILTNRPSFLFPTPTYALAGVAGLHRAVRCANGGRRSRRGQVNVGEKKQKERRGSLEEATGDFQAPVARGENGANDPHDGQ